MASTSSEHNPELNLEHITRSARGKLVVAAVRSVITPIKKLNPYQPKWAIRGPVTRKGNVHHFINNRGLGQVFNFSVTNTIGDNVALTTFGNIATTLFEAVQSSQVYSLYNGNLKCVNPQLSQCDSLWEIMLNKNSILQLCSDEESNIPLYNFQFTRITTIKEKTINTHIDVIGLMGYVSETSCIHRGDGIETKKRTISIYETSEHSSDVTLWGVLSETEGILLNDLHHIGTTEGLVLALKRVKLTSFNGRSLSTGLNSQCFINSIFPEAQELHLWFASSSNKHISVALNNTELEVVDISSVHKLAQLQITTKILLHDTISHFNMSNFCYALCTNMVNSKQCWKKVLPTDGNTWHYPNCNIGHPHYEYKYALNVLLEDTISTLWATTFEDVATSVMGISA
ncbi:hypothetical protein KI387_044210 [Taxus chinensis]|uniref:Replication protein A OB domain-containing protein n=1 Tax=Taxus chinensis TaxID=29808 RepID=A0AA38L776_TAXCH|nr:hypothetical protein KI387_044210 [Taxus chinensis]